MKKNTILSIMTCAVMLLLTAACSNDENNNTKEQPTQAVQFSFTNEDFGADETLSRATGAAETKPQTVDLGDCEAEISVESEPAVKTRGALTPASGHYTIRAYQAGTLKGEMKGAFSGGNFTPDASSHKMLNLPYGTYDFVAFNDDVTVSGTNLTTTRDKAGTARIGFATVNITGPTPIQVFFTMKHVGCRLHTQIVAPKHIEAAITATLESTAPNVIPTSVAYNPATKAYTATNGAMPAEANNSPISTETKYWMSGEGRALDYTSTGDYHYFLPNTQDSKLKLNFTGGKIFWKGLSGGTIPQLNNTLVMSPAKSYLVKITIKPKYKYLFSDGTTGFYKETISGGGTKTPVGVVVKENNGTPNSGLAVALKDAGAPCYWERRMGPIVQGNTVRYNLSTQLADINNDMKGEEYTYDGTYSDNGTAHASDPDFFAFQAAATYNPGVPLTGSLTGNKWYLPDFGEWMISLSHLAFTEQNAFPSWPSYIYNYPNLLNLAFTQVGGTKIWGGLEISNTKFYWTSTEIIDFGIRSASNIYWNYSQLSFNFSSGNDFFVRPFIKF